MLFPGAMGGLPVPMSAAPGLPVDGLSLGLPLPRPASPPVRGASASAETKASSAATTAGPSSGGASPLSAFQSRGKPHGVDGILQGSPPALTMPTPSQGFASADGGEHRGLKPVPGPHPASSQPLPPAAGRPGSASPHHPAAPSAAVPASAGGYPPLSSGLGLPSTLAAAPSYHSPADLTAKSSLRRTSQKGKQSCSSALVSSLSSENISGFGEPDRKLGTGYPWCKHVRIHQT